MSFNSELAPNIPLPTQLWRTLAGYIHAAFSLFGAPAELARKLWLSRAEHKICTSWLAALEALLRRLLYLDALELAPALPVAAERKARPRRAMPIAASAAFDIDHPECWRARFVLVRAENSAEHRRLPAGKPHQSAASLNLRPSAPLALRLEALIRAYNDREQAAQRLANLLGARAGLAHAIFAKLAGAASARPRAGPIAPDIAEAGRFCVEAGQKKFQADTS